MIDRLSTIYIWRRKNFSLSHVYLYFKRSIWNFNFKHKQCCGVDCLSLYIVECTTGKIGHFEPKHDFSLSTGTLYTVVQEAIGLNLKLNFTSMGMWEILFIAFAVSFAALASFSSYHSPTHCLYICFVIHMYISIRTEKYFSFHLILLLSRLEYPRRYDTGPQHVEGP